MDQNQVQIVLNDHLECPVCLEFAASPVYSCGNGHILCGICVDTVKKCTTCEGDAAKLIPMPFVDRLLRSEELTIPCRNEADGCKLTLKPHVMQLHLRFTCDFRPKKCTTGSFSNPTCKSYSPNGLFNHWLNVHKMTELIVSPSPGMASLLNSLMDHNNIGDGSGDSSFLGNISHAVCIRETDCAHGKLNMKKHVARITEVTLWNPTYLKLDGQTFILHTESKADMVHTWITLLGSEPVASGYKYVGSFRSRNYTETDILKHKIISFPEMPVHCLRFSDFDSVDALGDVMSIRHRSLKMLMNNQNPANPENVYEWSVEVRIFKSN